jgi:hypothetical protein
VLSVGVLSWKAHETLRKTLSSYKYLLPLVDEAVVFFNSITDEDREIAAEFGFRAEGSPENLGILGGTFSLVKCLRGDMVLLLQNDNPVNVPPDVLSSRMASAKRFLKDGIVDIVRMRDRFDPSFSDRLKYLLYWPDAGAPDTLSLRLRRCLRPLKACRMRGRAVDVLNDPSVRHPEVFSNVDGAFVSDSRFINYSDQPFMASRALALDLLEWADTHKYGSRTLNGRAVPEIVINGPYWRRKRIRIAITDGIFAHARYDDSFRSDHSAFNNSIAE